MFNSTCQLLQKNDTDSEKTVTHCFCQERLTKILRLLSPAPAPAPVAPVAAPAAPVAAPAAPAAAPASRAAVTLAAAAATSPLARAFATSVGEGGLVRNASGRSTSCRSTTCRGSNWARSFEVEITREVNVAAGCLVGWRLESQFRIGGEEKGRRMPIYQQLLKRWNNGLSALIVCKEFYHQSMKPPFTRHHKTHFNTARVDKIQNSTNASSDRVLFAFFFLLWVVCQHWIRNWSNVLLSDFVQVLKRSLLWMHLALALFLPKGKNTGHSNEAINLFMIYSYLNNTPSNWISWTWR